MYTLIVYNFWCQSAIFFFALFAAEGLYLSETYSGSKNLSLNFRTLTQ